jgi:hypothetical protein
MNFLIFSFFLFGYSQDNREGKAVIDSQLSFKYVKSIKQQIDEGTFVPSREIEKTKKIRNDMKEDNYNITIGKSQESALSEKLVKDQIEKQKKTD